MKLWTGWRSLTCGTVACLAVAGAVQAQTYPRGPIKIVVPYPTGGIVDILARAIGPKISVSLGQPVVVESRAGAGGNVGSALVAKSAPDGYTLLIGTAGAFTINPHTYKSLPYDPINDLAPIAALVQNIMSISVNPALPVQNLREFIDYARKHPRKLNFATPGTGTSHHLAGELFKQMAGIDMVHVPYKGGPPAVLDTITGQVQVGILSLANSLQFIRSGKLRALAVVEDTRAPAAPEIPTAGETVKGFKVSSWLGLFAPAGTSTEIVHKLNAEVVKALNAPDVRAMLESQGVGIIVNSPEQFAAQIKSDFDRWGKLIKSLGLQLD